MRWLRKIFCEEERQPDGRSGVIAVEMQSAGIETFKVTVEHGAQAQPGASVEVQVKGDCTTVEVTTLIDDTLGFSLPPCLRTRSHRL